LLFLIFWGIHQFENKYNGIKLNIPQLFLTILKLMIPIKKAFVMEKYFIF